MTHATPDHRRMDDAFDEALARDGDDDHVNGGPLLSSRDRAKDSRSLNRRSDGKVLLAFLAERVSGRGTRYLTGWLGRARIVAFREVDAEGNEGWNVYASTPQPRPGGGQP